MWSSRFVREARNLHKLAVGGGSVLLGSVLLAQDQKPQAEQTWRLEHNAPHKTDEVKLSRKVTALQLGAIQLEDLKFRSYRTRIKPVLTSVSTSTKHARTAAKFVPSSTITGKLRSEHSGSNEL